MRHENNLPNAIRDISKNLELIDKLKNNYELLEISTIFNKFSHK